MLGVDPGTRKAGLAVVQAVDGAILARRVCPLGQLDAIVSELVSAYGLRVAALGGGTHAAPLGAALAALGLRVELVDERETTLQARRLYFAEKPPRGWRRLVPAGMLLPPEPIDDFAAALIARRWLKKKAVEESNR